jgi:glutamate/tyrosine decarboxylase-like PLP-dependent enzyme
MAGASVTKHSSPLLLEPVDRAALWSRLIQKIEEYVSGVDDLRVAPTLDPDELRRMLEPYTFEQPQDPLLAMDFVVRGSWQHQVHSSHIHYYGLFNPQPATMSIAADALVAAFNPQLAGWSHSPFAVEVEQHLVRAFGERFGYNSEVCDGTLTSGGAEANHSGVLCALTHHFPPFSRGGVRGLDAQPVFYVSDQSHHSLLKAARMCGLGTDAVHVTTLDADGRMDVDALATQIHTDRRQGFAPFMVAGTAGTTSAGIVDPLPALAELCARENLWFHVDAAWGGAAVMVPELRGVLSGIERADSITFDAHKWLSVPMGAGIFLTRHRDILHRTFRIATGYMPREAEGMEITDPYTHSMQWTRRFIGLKVLLTLAVAGWDGYALAIRQQTAMGDLLRRFLRESGWEVVNRTELPVVCFRDLQHNPPADADAIARRIVASGKAWLSTIPFKGGLPVLRACVTNYRTGPDEIRRLVSELDAARQIIKPPEPV